MKVIDVNCVQCGVILTAYGKNDTTIPNCNHHKPVKGKKKN